MKRLFLVLASLALLLPAALKAADFEGTVHMKITSNKKVVELDYQVKGGMVRTVLPTGKGSPDMAMIMDTTNGTMTVMMPQQKMYMVRPLVLPKASLAHPGAGGDHPIVADGETKTILGYKCTKYLSPTAEGTTVEAWVTADLGNFTGFGGGMGGRSAGAGSSQDWAKSIAGQGFFPLLVIDKDSAGNEKSRMEVTNVDKTALADSVFQPPAGYTKFDVGAFAHP